jgi:hypothetical protein
LIRSNAVVLMLARCSVFISCTDEGKLKGHMAIPPVQGIYSTGNREIEEVETSFEEN